MNIWPYINAGRKTTSYKVTGVILFFLIISVILFSCSSSKVKRTVLFQGSKTYPWKVVYVCENHFPAGRTHYYEVFYGEKQLIIPKGIFGSITDVSAFTSANGFDIQHENSNAVLLTIENKVKQDNGFHFYQFISFFVAKINDGKKKPTFWVYNLDKEKIAEFEH